MSANRKVRPMRTAAPRDHEYLGRVAEVGNSASNIERLVARRAARERRPVEDVDADVLGDPDAPPVEAEVEVENDDDLAEVEAELDALDDGAPEPKRRRRSA